MLLFVRLSLPPSNSLSNFSLYLSCSLLHPPLPLSLSLFLVFAVRLSLKIRDSSSLSCRRLFIRKSSRSLTPPLVCSSGPKQSVFDLKLSTDWQLYTVRHMQNSDQDSEHTRLSVCTSSLCSWDATCYFAPPSSKSTYFM